MSLVDAIVEWGQRFPAGIVDISQLPIPCDDDYGLESIIQLKPLNADSCPMEIGVTLPQAGSTIYIFLDRWSHIGKLGGVFVPPNKADLVGLYVEPIELSIDRVIEICGAVATGAVFLDVGIFRGRLFCTAGYVQLSSGRFSMSGPCGGLPLVRIASLVGHGRIVQMSYAPWLKEDVALA